MKRNFFCILAGMLLIMPCAFSQNFIPKGRIFENNVQELNSFGHDVAIFGNFAIVGSRFEETDALGNNPVPFAGAAYIYERNAEGNWIYVQKLVAGDRAAEDFFGESVGISGDYAVVGASREDEDSVGLNTLNNSGAAYIFKRQDNGIWEEMDKIVAKDRAEDDRFGGQVSVYGNHVLVGNPLKNDMDGAVYVYYQNNSGEWIQIQKLVSNDQQILENFGSSVFISENFAVIGASGEDSDGACFVYKLNQSGKLEYQETISPTPADVSMDRFGIAVSLSGNYLIAGANYDSHNATGTGSLYAAGSAYIFEYDGTTWHQVKKLVAPDRAERDMFGSAVAISGDNAMVGSWGDLDINGEDPYDMAGAVYFYHRNQAGDWEYVNKTVSDQRNEAGFYGSSIDLSGDYAIIGAYDDDQIGLNDTLENTGAVYFYEQENSTGSKPAFRSNFSFYPNPARNKQIIIKAVPGAVAKFYNSYGVLLMTIHLNSEEDQMQLKDLPSGIYFVEIALSTERICSKLIIP